MSRDFAEMHGRLENRFFLSSMMGLTDGAFCSQRSKGCAMVQLGAYLAEPTAYGDEPWFLPSDAQECTELLARENTNAKAAQNVITCLNFASPRLDWALEVADCFHKAGGDFVELNVHGTYEPYLRIGKVRAMVLPENRDELFRWVEALSKLEIPLIVKFREGIVDDYSQVLEELADFDVLAVHFNVRDERTKTPDFDFVQDIKRDSPIFLMASGYVRSAEDARTLFERGADMVGIAEPTIENLEYIHGIARRFRRSRGESRCG